MLPWSVWTLHRGLDAAKWLCCHTRAYFKTQHNLNKNPKLFLRSRCPQRCTVFPSKSQTKIQRKNSELFPNCASGLGRQILPVWMVTARLLRDFPFWPCFFLVGCFPHFLLFWWLQVLVRLDILWLFSATNISAKAKMFGPNPACFFPRAHRHGWCGVFSWHPPCSARNTRVGGFQAHDSAWIQEFRRRKGF